MNRVVIKRDGLEKNFDITCIEEAIKKNNKLWNDYDKNHKAVFCKYFLQKNADKNT